MEKLSSYFMDVLIILNKEDYYLVKYVRKVIKSIYEIV